MDNTHDILVDSKWLYRHLRDENLIIVDCRFDFLLPERGEKEYLSGHIPGSIFLDLERDLSGRKGEHGGRHPLPDDETFQNRMRSIGLSERSVVVAYGNDLSVPARLWWMLCYFGHRRCHILDGGFEKWKKSGLPVSSLPPEPRPTGNFTIKKDRGMIVFSEDIRNGIGDSRLIDARARERYAGEVEPLDAKAGHIPGAINIPYTSVMTDEGIMDLESLRRIFSESGDNPVFYCGSGVTACVNVLAMHLLGLRSRLYAGSWSDWVSYRDDPVAVSESPDSTDPL